LACAIVLGGASQHNILLLALVELVSIPVLLLAARQLWRTGAWRGQVFAIGVLAATVAVPLMQLVPLPPGLWRQLPNRGSLEIAMRLAGVTQPWLPITLVPEETLRNALALLPPAAMFLAVLCADRRQQSRLVSTAIGLCVASVVLGAAQAASGGQSPLYFYSPSHLGMPIGFFSNRNHQAVFLLSGLPMATLWAIEPRGDRNWRLPPAIPFVLFGLLIVGAIATRSRAGLLLLGPAIVACLALAWRRGRLAVGRWTFAIMVGVILVAMLSAAQFLILNVLPRFDLNQTPELRFDTWPQVLKAASSYIPFGSGVGTFIPVYQSVEPLSLLQSEFWNHAHNEYLELWLETGWMGAAVLIAFAVWYVRTAFAAWGSRAGEAGSLRRVGTIVVALLLAHSIVDYPLRTEALATLFALACALMAHPSSRPRLKGVGLRSRNPGLDRGIDTESLEPAPPLGH
jgi:O-antigen ligase